MPKSLCPQCGKPKYRLALTCRSCADKRRTGEGNNLWRGGRTITPHGYVLVRLPGHHLADVRGYVYEHRLVAEEMLGRQLRDGELVHHLNGDKTDNRPENLEVHESNHHHFVRHRYSAKYQGLYELRLPDEANPLIACACGCAMEFLKFDSSGRPRFFVSGHNIGRDSMGRWAAHSPG